MANGRAAPVAQHDTTVIELLAAYKRFATGYYKGGGTEYDNALLSIKPLLDLYAHLRR